MKDNTHYWFSVVILLVATADSSRVTIFDKIVFFIAVLLCSFIALIPNYLENLFCSERCRHPATHHPIIPVLIVFGILLTPITKIDLESLQLFAKIFILSYGSHLFLDVFTEEGIPLSITPTLFLQDPTKHYTFNDKTKSRKRVQFSQFSVLKDTSGIDQKISLFCQGTVIFYCFQLAMEVFTSLSSMEQIAVSIMMVFDYLHSIQGGIIP